KTQYPPQDVPALYALRQDTDPHDLPIPHFEQNDTVLLLAERSAFLAHCLLIQSEHGPDRTENSPALSVHARQQTSVELSRNRLWLLAIPFELETCLRAFYI